MSDETKLDDTKEFPVVPFAFWSETGSSRVVVDVATASHIGLVRTNNEDHCLAVRFGRWMEPLSSNLPAHVVPPRMEEVCYGLVVADGIGGREGGEVASQLAITTLLGLVLETPDWILSTDPDDTKAIIRRMEARWRRVQEIMRERGRRDPALEKMGTTMCVAATLANNLIVGHVGDSRVYLFRNGQLLQLTRDHTLVQHMVDLGLITAEEAVNHARRNVLTRSFSAAGSTFQGDFQQLWLADGDQILLCTDGLTDMVENAAIAAVLSGATTADNACQSLVDEALKNGGTDNVTVALARYRIPK